MSSGNHTYFKKGDNTETKTVYNSSKDYINSLAKIKVNNDK
jgi:hypothetical protein